jgi:hypothetical protein
MKTISFINKIMRLIIRGRIIIEKLLFFVEIAIIDIKIIFPHNEINFCCRTKGIFESNIESSSIIGCTPH